MAVLLTTLMDVLILQPDLGDACRAPEEGKLAAAAPDLAASI
jgi:hypothetical protein